MESEAVGKRAEAEKMVKEMELCVYCAQKLDGTLDMKKRQWPVFGKCANCGKETVVQPFTVGQAGKKK